MPSNFLSTDSLHVGIIASHVGISLLQTLIALT